MPIPQPVSGKEITGKNRFSLKGRNSILTLISANHHHITAVHNCYPSKRSCGVAIYGDWLPSCLCWLSRKGEAACWTSPGLQRSSAFSLYSGMKDSAFLFSGLGPLQVVVFQGLGCLNPMGASLINEVFSCTRFLNFFLYPSLSAVRWPFVTQGLQSQQLLLHKRLETLVAPLVLIKTIKRGFLLIGSLLPHQSQVWN